MRFVTRASNGAYTRQLSRFLLPGLASVPGIGSAAHVIYRDELLFKDVARAFHSRRSRPTLVDERLERSYGVHGLFVLGLALFENSFGTFVLCQR